MINIAIMGFGTVGSGTFEIIENNPQKLGKLIKVTRVLDLRKFENSPVSKILTNDFNDILNDDSIKIVVETIGGTGFVYDYTKALLIKGKTVVTSNKEMVVEHGQELEAIAAKNNAKYMYEASVCGGIPIIRPLRRCLGANNITEIKGILNGTTNYILTKMLQTGEDFASVLKQAQELGYAEKDPSADIDGHDTCRKIAILARIAFGELGVNINWQNISTTGVRNITLEELHRADADGYAIRLIGHAVLEDGVVKCSVAPTKLIKENPLANVVGVNNAVLVSGDAVGDVMFYGPGAGSLATGSAIIADILEVI